MLVETIIPSGQYIHIASLCTILWDIVIHISEDFDHLLGSKLSLASSVFLLSRVSTVGQAVASVVFSFSTSPTCQSALTAEIFLFTFSMCSTSLLFFFRARAVFLGSRRATLFFLVLWMIVMGSCSAQAFSITAVSSLPGEVCKIEKMETACNGCLIAAAMNDVIVFVLISWKIITFFAAEEGGKLCFAYFCGRAGLPMISQILLRTGQQYFLLAVTIKFLGSAVMHIPGMSATLSVSLLIPLVVLENAMGCKVFRDIKLDLAVRNGSLSSIPSRPMEFVAGSQRSNSRAMEQSLLLAV